MVEINRKAFQYSSFYDPYIFQFLYFSEIVDLCNNNRTEFTPMMDRNCSICCYSTYPSKIFPGPLGLNTRGTPHLVVVVISPPIRYHLNKCDKFNVLYVYLIIGQISFHLMDVNFYSTKLLTLLPLSAPA